MTPINHPFRRHALAIALALASGTSQAATINVTGACTLVNAINNANSDTDTDGAGGCPAGSGADTITLEANATYTLTTVDNTHTGPNGLPVISSKITINGNNATVERSTATDTPYFRLLQISSHGNALIDSLNLTYGSSLGVDAGGILNEGHATLTKCNVSNSVSYGAGGILNLGNMTLVDSKISDNNTRGSLEAASGAIVNQGSMTITNSQVSENGLSGSGATAAILNQGHMVLTNSFVQDNGGSVVYAADITNYGDMTLTNSTISDNYSTYWATVFNLGDLKLINSNVSDNWAEYFAAIFNRDGATVTITNSTISGNRGSGFINEGGNVTLSHSTISDNIRWGLYNSLGEVTVINSVIANHRYGDCVIDQTGAINLQGINFIADGSCGAPLSGDVKLRPLLDNGGLTFTHALHGNSRALAAADSAFCTNTDQRNVKRPPKNKVACDLGAFERKPVISSTIAALVSFFDTAAANGGIVGVNNFDERIALRNQLLTAGDYKQRNLATQACSQLTRTLGYIDADNSPETGDYVTGTEADALTDEINALKTSWSCQ